MWVFLNDAFISAVQHREDADKLMVRARIKGDLEKIWPDKIAEVQRTPHADYLFRLVVSRADMDAAMLREVRRINYANFKGSVDERWRHDAYMRIWTVMHQEQIRHAPELIGLPVVAPQFYADKPKAKAK